MSAPDVVVVGAGAIGCATALRLAQAHLRVAVIDRGEPGGGSSGAAAGMLLAQAGLGGAVSEPEADHLAARAGYAAFVREVEELSGEGTGYGVPGALAVALSEQDAARLREAARAQQARGLRARFVEGAEARTLDPAIAPDAAGAVDLPDEARVDAAALSRALRRAAERAGAELRAGVEARTLLVEAGRARGVTTAAGPIHAGAVVVAAGVGSGRLGPVLDRLAPVEPVRGQIVELRADPPAPRRILIGPRGYLCPHADGRADAGSTVEPGAERPRPTAAGVRDLIAMAVALAPALAGAVFAGARAGLRPRCRDGRARTGATDVPGLYLATGHYRDGILMAPRAARACAEAVIAGRTG